MPVPLKLELKQGDTTISPLICGVRPKISVYKLSIYSYQYLNRKGKMTNP